MIEPKVFLEATTVDLRSQLERMECGHLKAEWSQEPRPTAKSLLFYCAGCRREDELRIQLTHEREARQEVESERDHLRTTCAVVIDEKKILRQRSENAEEARQREQASAAELRVEAEKPDRAWHYENHPAGPFETCGLEYCVKARKRLANPGSTLIARLEAAERLGDAVEGVIASNVNTGAWTDLEAALAAWKAAKEGK